VQVVRSTLRKRGGVEYGTLVGFQNGQPCGKVGCVIGARFEGDLEIGAQERCTNLGDEFLAGIGMIGEALTEIAIATVCRRCPVDQFVQ